MLTEVASGLRFCSSLLLDQGLNVLGIRPALHVYLRRVSRKDRLRINFIMIDAAFDGYEALMSAPLGNSAFLSW